MKFKNMFKYETKDGVFKIIDLPEVLSRELCLDKLKEKDQKEGRFHTDEYYKLSWVNKEITENKITVYNTVTNRFSDKSLYINKQGKFYFKGQIIYDKPLSKAKRYYIDELKPYDETTKCEE